jgi:hypothetical protein
MFQTNLPRKSNYTFYVQMRFSESRAIYEIMWKKYGVARQATGGNTMWRTRVACWINKAIDTHSECVILIAFQGKNWLPKVPQCYVIGILSCSCFTMVCKRCSRNANNLSSHKFNSNRVRHEG